MFYLLLVVFVLAITFGPQIWVRWVMNRYSAEIPGMPGTGGELARHLIETHDLDGVTVERTENLGDHYDPTTKTVRLAPANFEGKSLTAVAVAAHEVGHAIQHQKNDANLAMRTRLAPLVTNLGRLSVFAVTASPVIGILTRHPVPFSLLLVLGLSGLVARVLLHVVTLPTEWDASFDKALPAIRRGQYVAPHEQSIITRILRAAALTYVAAAMADVLNLARWAAIVLRR